MSNKPDYRQEIEDAHAVLHQYGAQVCLGDGTFLTLAERIQALVEAIEAQHFANAEELFNTGCEAAAEEERKSVA